MNQKSIERENFTALCSWNLTVGVNQTNNIKIEISPKPSTNPIKLSKISLEIPFGEEETALVEASSLPNSIKFHVDGKVRNLFGKLLDLKSPTGKKNKKDSTYTWTTSIPPSSTIESTLTLSLDSFLMVSEGNAELKITIEHQDKTIEDFNLEVEKKKPNFGILKFTAKPRYLLRDESTVLSWKVAGAKSVILVSNDGERAPEPRAGWQEGEWTNKPRRTEGTITYTLTAESQTAEKREEATVTVYANSSSWIALDYSDENDLGEPMTLFKPQTQQNLYAIFRNTNVTALYGSDDGMNNWTVESTLPTWMEERESSPGVEWNNKLWLVGGDSTNIKTCSNQVASFDITENVWTEEREGEDEGNGTDCWKPRMGHTVLVFDDKLWVIGGFSNNGREPLNDVWVSEDGKTWQEKTSHASWHPRCMFAATVFDNKIWIYGGVERPGGKPINDFWSSSDGITWALERKLPPKLTSKGEERIYPWGCALDVIDGDLFLCCTYAVGTEGTESKESGSYACRQNRQGDWKNIPLQGMGWEDNEGSSFSLTTAVFGERLFLRSLRDPYGERQAKKARKLHIYVSN